MWHFRKGEETAQTSKPPSSRVALIRSRLLRSCETMLAPPTARSSTVPTPESSQTPSAASREEQRDVLERALKVARLLGAPVVRAFSFWRVPDPASVRGEVVRVLSEAVERTQEAGLELGLENEHECNVGTGAETRWVLDLIPSPSFGVIWDPGNEAMMGSEPFPGGYSHVQGRVTHVHLKDVDDEGNWTKVGTGIIDYPGQLRALAEDGYAGVLSLETHYEIPGGGLGGATRESVAAIRTLCEQAGVKLSS